MQKPICLAAAFLCLCVISPVAAKAQAPGAYGHPLARPYAAAETRPTVSPYLNLSNTNLGSYQTLVRPLIDEREELNRQWAQLDKLNQQLGGAPGAVAPPDANRSPTRGRAGSGVRFMHYSHYYGKR